MADRLCGLSSRGRWLVACAAHDESRRGTRASGHRWLAPVSATDGETLWPAPAKLNLFLHITGRRPDGYHELQTVFQLVDLCDTIGIRTRDDGRIERSE